MGWTIFRGSRQPKSREARLAATVTQEMDTAAQVCPGSDRGHGTDLSAVQPALVERDLDVDFLAIVVVGRGQLQGLVQAPQFGRRQFGQLFGDQR